MYKIGLSTCNNITEKFFENCAKAGVEVVEISGTKETCDNLSFKDVLSWSKKYGVALWSLHVPFAPFEIIDISNKQISKQTVEYVAEVIKKASDIGIDKFIIHPSGEPISDEDRNERLKTAKESLFNLAEIANTCGGVIAVENLPRTCLGKNSDEIKELISANDKLRVCFDTNHLLQEKSIDFIKNIGDKIVTTHVSDYDFMNERHWLPSEGDLDWQAILSTLKNVNYKGPWLYEVGFECPKTIYRDRDLTCEDFVKNAKELFENKPITVISRKKENLGMWE